MKFSIARRRVKGQIWQWALVAMVVLAGPASARADVLTYYPSGSAAGANDLGDLDHTNYYAWTITGIAPVQSVTSAFLTFKNMYNWDNTANVLYLDLLDNAATGGTQLVSGSGDANGATAGGSYSSNVRYAVDASGAPVTVYNDKFDGSNSLAPTGLESNLTEHSFLPSAAINSIDNNPFQSGDISWLQGLLSAAGIPMVDATFGGSTGWTVTNGTTGYDYKYTFSSGQLTTLTNYIDGINGAGTAGTIGLALDPDCHFYNDGVSFTMVTQSFTTAAVPEPASLFLLGSGLVFCARRYRRKTSTASA